MATHKDVSSADLLAQALKSAEYDNTYQESVRSIERVVEEERARELRVQLLLLEDENDSLQAELEQSDTKMERLENCNADLCDELADTKAQLAQVQTDLKVRVRELEHARAEVTALNNASTDAANMLADKLALTRELATLKPELEYLKSQRATQQNVLAEKLSLEREISAMQVELDNEKRTVERLKSQGKMSSEEESARAAEVEELKKDLAQAKKAASAKMDKQNAEMSELRAELERLKQDEWESEKELLENKLDAFRTKLRSTKEQLRTAQDELETAQADRMAQSAELTKARMVRKTVPPAANANRGKRNVTRFDPDATIGTPGQGPAKRQRTSVSVGDKSTVSMTPFFNKTALMAVAVQNPATKKASTTARKVPHPLRESTTKANTVVKRRVALALQKPSSEAAAADDDSDDSATLSEPENTATTTEETETMPKKKPL
ncbi:hypothetical protein DV735_g5582, partial [Chaetothyriales sp. CBS 134920]